MSQDVEYQNVIINLNQAFEPDDALMLYTHTRLAMYCEPYLPMREGILLATQRITPECIHYPTPYAHYMYMGEVYAPNIPIRSKETGEIIGWFSPPNKPKYPTGRKINYRRDLHPLATDHWDMAAMAEHRQDLVNDIETYIAYRTGMV